MKRKISYFNITFLSASHQCRIFKIRQITIVVAFLVHGICKITNSWTSPHAKMNFTVCIITKLSFAVILAHHICVVTVSRTWTNISTFILIWYVKLRTYVYTKSIILIVIVWAWAIFNTSLSRRISILSKRAKL